MRFKSLLKIIVVILVEEEVKSMDTFLLLEHGLLKKREEKNITPYRLFVDYIHAYVSASRYELWDALENYR
jgi:hypothetical protein